MGLFEKPPYLVLELSDSIFTDFERKIQKKITDQRQDGYEFVSLSFREFRMNKAAGEMTATKAVLVFKRIAD